GRGEGSAESASLAALPRSAVSASASMTAPWFVGACSAKASARSGRQLGTGTMLAVLARTAAAGSMVLAAAGSAIPNGTLSGTAAATCGAASATSTASAIPNGTVSGV